MEGLIDAYREKRQLGSLQKYLGRRFNKIFELATIAHVRTLDDGIYRNCILSYLSLLQKRKFNEG